MARPRKSPCVSCGTLDRTAFGARYRVCVICCPADMRWCWGCNASLSPTAFGVGRSEWCLVCRKRKWADRGSKRYRDVRSWTPGAPGMDKTGRYVAIRLLVGARKRAEQRGLGFDASREFREDVVSRVLRGRCELTDLPFSKREGGRHQCAYSPSLDRIDPAKGYVPGNVRVVLWAVNASIGSWGLDVALDIARALVSQHRAVAQAA